MSSCFSLIGPIGFSIRLLRDAPALLARAWGVAVFTVVGFAGLGFACLALAHDAAAQIPQPGGGIEQRRNVIAVVPRSWPPQYQQDAEGNPIGFAIDVMNEVAKRAGLTITYKVAENFSAAVDILARGEADLIPNSGIVAERLDRFAFTAPVETFVVSLFVRRDTDNLNNVSDLAGRNLAVVERNVGAFMFAKRQDINVQVLADVRSALFQLLAGHVDALVYPRPVILNLAREIGVGDRIKTVGKPLREIHRGILVMKANTALLAILDPAVKGFVGTPAYQRIYAKWYEKPRPSWSRSRITLLMGLLLAFVLLGMGLWRYRSVIRLNKMLKEEADERRAVERSLAESEIRATSIMENASDGIITIDDRGLIESFNPAAERMFGYGAQEVIGQNVAKLMTAQDAGSHDDHLRSYGETGEGKIIGVGPREVTGRRKDGSTFPLELAIDEMYLGDRRLFIGDLRDITERKRVEEKSAEKSALLETILTNIAQGFCVYDRNQKLVAYNEEFVEMAGFPPDFIHLGIDRREVLRFLAKQYNYSEDEIDKWVEKRISNMKGEEGIPVERQQPNNRYYIFTHKTMPDGGIVASYTDITDLKQVEREAAAKSALLEATFENMIQGIAVYDADHTLVAFNPQYGEILGLPSDYLHIGINRADIFRYRMQQGQFYGADVEATVEERLASARQPEKAERTLPNGRSYAFDLTPTPAGGYIITLTDITERHAADKRLQQAQKMEAVGQLTGGIAHDFNNLLAVSLGNVELAEEVAESGGDVRPFLATIKRAGERGAALTSQLLAFSRKQSLFPQVIDAGDLVEGMSHLLRSALGETIEVKVAGDDGLWPCEVDPHQLESAILNLALNARDAMPSGGTLSIQTTNVSLDDDYAAVQAEVAPGEYVLVAVTDTGTGMAQEVIDHAFDPFFTTKEVGRGSGLGLSMVYGFVKQSGGHVTIYSEEGIGTTLKLYLPRSDKADERIGGAKQTDVPKAQGETVMVVEDDPEVRTLSVALLGSFGYEILEAADGESALKILDSAPRVNLLFTDVVLPGGMSGPQLAVEVRNRFPGIAVLCTSGYTDLANVDRSTLGDDAELLQKPYRKADLARKVRLALDQARS